MALQSESAPSPNGVNPLVVSQGRVARDPITQRYQANVQAPRFHRIDGLFLRSARDLRAARHHAGWLHARRDLDRLLVVRRRVVWYRRVACHLLIPIAQRLS